MPLVSANASDSLPLIAVLNGPNLDRLGEREPEVYGRETLADLRSRLEAQAAGKARLHFLQSNHEGVLIDEINRLARSSASGIIINPGGLTHTSVSLRDSIAGSGIRTIEVHISNIHRRESFRHVSMTAASCIGVIAGLGLAGYSLALSHLLDTQ
jgi:3-dehydroquinate dehydratase-2